MSSSVPTDAPPAYSEATSSSKRQTGQGSTLSPQTARIRNGIPTDRRRSIEDEARPLPEGWVRQFDQESEHQFFVDTRSDPPRSIWAHPYDDEQYMSSLSPAERQKIAGLHRVPTDDDMRDESSMDDHTDDERHAKLPPRQNPADNPKGVHKLGRKMKDKLTNSTHQEREIKRQKRAEEEQRIYQMHQKVRAAMVKASQTGQPQLVGKDRNGKDIYVEPPSNNIYPGYGGGYGNLSGYGGYNPYSSGMYAAPNARYIRPQMAYSRPYGYGYGGGMGLPLLGGLGGGLLLGGLLGGF